ncbi:MAG: formylglycine-generating enzyme family protein, partial [Betaproteobacteria bacterium]
MPRDFSLESALALCAGAACVLTLATVSADAAETSAARVRRDCPACPELVVIPAGEFMMGSEFAESGHPDEKPRHKVTIAKPFALSRTEVTFDQWAACVAEGKCREPSDDDLGRGDRPVINVTWQEARDFAAWLSAKTGQRYRLPTEAEWEYAARGGTATPWFWG